jgi:hypothetical protein
VQSDHEAGRPAAQDIRLRPGEDVRARIAANAVQRGRTFGGQLYLTNKRLIFMPNPYGQSRGATRFETRLKEIAQLDLAARGWTIWDGSWRRRLSVTTRTGAIVYFIAWRPRQVLDLIERARSGDRPS